MFDSILYVLPFIPQMFLTLAVGLGISGLLMRPLARLLEDAHAAASVASIPALAAVAICFNMVGLA